MVEKSGSSFITGIFSQQSALVSLGSSGHSDFFSQQLA
jgi:hypothetical protein